MAGAVARQLGRYALDALARMEAERGPVDEDDVAAILARLEG